MDTTLNKTFFPSSRLLPIIILIEGFVSIGIEILTIRQLLPVAGGSVIVTSLIIGIFLLFLALGYHRGGQIHLNLPERLRKNFFIAAVWLGIGLSYIFIGFFFYLTQKITGPHVIYPLIIYLLFITAPLIYVLGQTVPITMNMVKNNLSAGTIGGNTLGISTIGSFLGAIFTTLILMFYFGVAFTVFFNSLLLIFLHLLLIDQPKVFLNHLCLSLVAGIMVYFVNIKFENTYFVLTNNYANYQIYDYKNSKVNKGEKLLIINDALSSFIDNKNKGFPYVEMIKKILFFDMNLQNAEVLVLGAGGFSITAETTHDNHFTYVDIDSQITKATVPKFINHLKSALISDDARHYLQSTKMKYDVIISDAYSDVKSVPAYLLTREYMHTIKNRLTADGIAIFNIIEKPMLSDPYSKRIDNTIRSVFQNCMVIPQSYTSKITNVLYICHQAKNEADKVIYSDNLNNSTTDSFSW